MTAVKCLVWDLDDTLWDGVVLEGDRPRPFSTAVETLRILDQRGILHAVASRGHYETAAEYLAEHGLAELFCVLDIGWGAKSEAIRRIAAELNIGLETVAFADNDAVERAEVATALPMVRCYPAERIGELAALPEFRPRYVTDESRLRRHRYLDERRRTTAEQEFIGSRPEFLASLGLTMTVRRAGADDLARAHELTVRTHQLNTTGRAFGMRELRDLCASERHEVLVAGLTDRFGSYGTVGLAVIDLTTPDAVLELLLMSCRVMSRGVGAVLLGQIVRDKVGGGRRLLARFVRTPVNKIMLVTLRFAGFALIERDGDQMTLAFEPSRPLPAPPGHVRVVDGGRR